MSNRLAVFLFLLPGLCGLVIFSIPFRSVHVLRISLTEWDVIGLPPRFHGLKNFSVIFVNRRILACGAEQHAVLQCVCTFPHSRPPL